MLVRFCIVVSGLIGSAVGQEQPTAQRLFAPRPLVTMWHTGFSQKTVMNYLKSVSEEVGFEKELEQGLMRELNKGDSRAHIKGTMVFLVRGLPPDVETIEFREVKDKAQFLALANARKTAWGETAKLTEGEDGCYTVTATGTWEETLTEMKPVKQANGSVKMEPRFVLDEKGQPKKKTHTWTNSYYYRLKDRVMYEAPFAELHSLELPSGDEMGVGRRRRTDALYVDADLKQVPKGIKDIFWNLAISQTNALLQQRNTEAAIDYKFRRAASELVREFLRSVVYDIEHVTASVRFATDTQPLRASFDAKVRRQSLLAKQLKALGRGNSRLPVSEDAVLSLHSSWAMPQALRDLLKNSGPVFRKLGEREIKDADALAGVRSVATAFEESAAEGRFETMLHFGGSARSGPALYGALRLGADDRFVDGMYAIMSFAMKEAHQPGLPQIERVDLRGRRYIKISFPNLPLPLEARPTHAYLTSGLGAAWLAVGNENAYEILERELSAGPGRGRRPALASLKLDLARFLDQDDPAGFADYADAFEKTFDQLPTLDNPSYVRQHKQHAPPFRAIMQDVLGDTKDGTRLSLVFDANDDGLIARARVAEPLGKYLTARYMLAINRVVRMQRARMEEMMQRARAEQEKAKENARKALEKNKPDGSR